MEKYSSDTHRINHNINVVYDKLSNPALYRQIIESNSDKLPEEAKKNLDKIKFNEDGIAIQSPMGEVTLGIDKNTTIEPTRIVYTALSSPVKFNLVIELSQVDDNTTDEVASLELDIPFFMAKMVAPQLKEGAKKFGQMLTMLPYETI